MTPPDDRRVSDVNCRFADRARQVRQARGVSQQYLADRCGMPARVVQQIEASRFDMRGARKATVGEAALLAQALGVPLTWMLRADPLPTEALMGPVTIPVRAQ